MVYLFQQILPLTLRPEQDVFCWWCTVSATYWHTLDIQGFIQKEM